MYNLNVRYVLENNYDNHNEKYNTLCKTNSIKKYKNVKRLLSNKFYFKSYNTYNDSYKSYDKICIRRKLRIELINDDILSIILLLKKFYKVSIHFSNKDVKYYEIKLYEWIK